MAFSIGELVGVISLTDQFSGPIKKVGDELGVAGKSFNAVAGFAGIAATAIAGATTAVVMLGQRGAEVADVKGAFDNLAESVGSTGEAMLGALQQGTLGTISNFDLMSRSTGVLGSGMVKTAEEMGILAAGAQMVADRTGGDTAEAFDKLSGAMASGRTNGLKALGLFVDTDAAVNKMAISLGKQVKDLTDQEVAQAKANATLSALKLQLDATGPATADFGDQINRGKVAVANFVDGLAVAIATSPVVAAGMTAIQEGIAAAFGGDQTTLIQTLARYVGEFAIGLTYVAQGATTAATVLVTAWYAVKTAILGVLTVVAAGVVPMTETIAKALEFAAAAPLATQGMKDTASAAREFANNVRGVTGSLAEQTAEAAKGVVGNSDLQRTIDGLAGGIVNARTAMEGMVGATAGIGEKAAATKPPVDKLNESLTLTAAQTKAIEDQTRTSLEYMTQSWNDSVDVQRDLQNQISVLQTTGIQQRLLELDIARQKEIASIQHLAFEYPAQYEAIVAMITEKYGLMAGIATGANLTIAQAAANAGFQTRASLQETADKARELWADMVASGEFTEAEILKAKLDADKKKQESSVQTSEFNIATAEQMLAGIGSALEAFGIKSKELAIAGAILHGIGAVQKAWNSAPPPANLPAVAMVTAATVANIMKIRGSKAGYATGTPGTQFIDFGRVSTVDLHNREAIVTPKQGASVASMVEDALKLKDSRLVDELRGLRAEMAADRRALPIYIRDAALLANA